MSKRRLFVAGATGAVGRTLLSLASEKNVDVLPHVRPKSAAQLDAVPKVVLELSDPKLANAMSGCTTVVQLIGTMRKRFAAGDTYQTSDIDTTQQLLNTAKTCGTVDHIVLLSSIGAGSPRGAYLKAKAEAERLVMNSGIAWTIFRPSAFEDRQGAFFPGMRAITSALGLKKYQPIKLRELAGAILEAATTRAPLSTALEGEALWKLVNQSQGS